MAVRHRRTCALPLACQGAAWLAARCLRLLEGRVLRWPPGLSPVAVLVAAVAVLTPAWLQLGAYDHQDGAAIAAQRRADATRGADVDRLAAVIQRDGGGRTYAGMPSNWGEGFTVGAVPVFKYLESRDVDEVGYALRTASLMTDPEYFLNDGNPSGYRLFGIRYLILPARATPPARTPGWTATVNGRPEPVRMVAPALAAVDVPAGTDHVVFRFHGYGGYLPLLALSGLTLTVIAVAPVWARRRRS